jgi:hypothetical protein
MGISKMKDDLHARLWSAQQRWTKHDLKMQGIRVRGVPGVQETVRVQPLFP